jgi:hypothetical protein
MGPKSGNRDRAYGALVTVCAAVLPVAAHARDAALGRNKAGRAPHQYPELAPKRRLIEPADRRLPEVKLTLSRNCRTAAVDPSRQSA